MVPASAPSAARCWSAWPDAKLIAIDTNADFCDYLRHTIVDSRFAAVNGSAADVQKIVRDHGFDHADYVLSGLPFSTLPPGVGPAIAQATHDVLRPGGAFLVYQFSPKVKDFLVPHWDNIDHDMEWWNVPRPSSTGPGRTDLYPPRHGEVAGRQA